MACSARMSPVAGSISFMTSLCMSTAGLCPQIETLTQVPPGRVVCYGDIAELVGVGPRPVGRVMSTSAE